VWVLSVNVDISGDELVCAAKVIEFDLPARSNWIELKFSADLAVMADSQECSLTQGDVIMRLTDAPDADGRVNVSVASSKKSDCASGKLVAVSVDDLQEMRNRFEEQLDTGLKSLALKQGTGRIAVVIILRNCGRKMEIWRLSSLLINT
jgi:hypothetical protein